MSAISRPVPYPATFPPQAFRKALYHILTFSTPRSLPNIPPWLKYILLTLIIANIKSFPLYWHIKVFGSAIATRGRSRPSIHPLLFWIRSSNTITTSPGVSPRLRLDSIPIGKDIFNDRDITTFRNTVDDCDYNMHMSNSSYAKVLDYCRIAFLSKRLMRGHFDGLHFALGGSTYLFHTEIPFMAKYEVETFIGSWDEKWLYVVGRFYSPSPFKKALSDEILVPSKLSKSAQNLKALLADVTKPNQEDGSAARQAALAEASAQKASKRKLYCTSISRYCFKNGRKTIPPWFVIATSGYGEYASTRTNWDKAESLRRNVQTQRMAAYQEKNGRPMPRDNIVLGSAYRKAGIFAAYDPSRPENAKNDDRGLGAWQDRSNWQTTEWEERRANRLEALTALGGVASLSKAVLNADALNDLPKTALYMDETRLEQFDLLDCVRIATETDERGLVLTKAALPSESILILPSKSLLNVSTLKDILAKELLPTAESPSHPRHWRETEDEDQDDEPFLPLTSVQALTLALALWSREHFSGKKSRLDTLLLSFPKDIPTFPIIWKAISEDDFRERCILYSALLKALPTHIGHLCDKVHKRFQKDYAAIRSIEARAQHLIGKDHRGLTLKHLCWAWCSVNSRCVHIPLGLKNHLDNFTLAPLLDMANHTFDKSVECKVKWTPAGGLQLFAPAKSRNGIGLETGQEIFITYGAHSNGTLLSEYGFTLPSTSSGNSAWDGNPYAEINIDHIIEEHLEEQIEYWGQQKIQLLKEYDYYNEYTIHPFPSPAHPSHRLVVALRLIAIKPSNQSLVRQSERANKKQKTMNNDDDDTLQIQTWKDMVNGQKDIVSAENEAAVHDLLLCICYEIISNNRAKKVEYQHFVETWKWSQRDLEDPKFKSSYDLVMNLLQEEVRIAEMMKDAIRRGSTDW